VSFWRLGNLASEQAANDVTIESQSTRLMYFDILRARRQQASRTLKCEPLED
jgi:hypothetical protein